MEEILERLRLTDVDRAAIAEKLCDPDYVPMVMTAEVRDPDSFDQNFLAFVLDSGDVADTSPEDDRPTPRHEITSPRWEQILERFRLSDDDRAAIDNITLA